jgi:GTP-binding protein Era
MPERDAQGASAPPHLPHRTGVVALLGPPNVGKSTLLNRLVGEKLAIVSAKPQTTRGRLLGILTLPDAQLLLLDTPGLHAGAGALHEAMRQAAEEAVRDCDLALVLVDRGRGWEPAHEIARAALAARGRRWLLVGTKADAMWPGSGLGAWPPPEAAAAEFALEVSARTGEGIEALVRAVSARLPEGAALHAQDALTDRPLRFLAAELVREAAFELLHEEVPYAVAVEIEEFDESRPDLVRIRANLLIERASQKRIVVGSGGAMIREIGRRARLGIEQLVGTRVHLALWVKEDPRWSQRARRVEELGYR